MYELSFIPTRANQFIHVQKTLKETEFGNENLEALFWSLETKPTPMRKQDQSHHRKIDLKREGIERKIHGFFSPCPATKHARFLSFMSINIV